MDEDRVNQISRQMAEAVRDYLRAGTDIAVTTQEHNVKFTRNLFEAGVELLWSQAESNRRLTQSLLEHGGKQQEAIGALAREPMEAYMDLADSMFSSAWRGREATGQAAQEVTDAAERRASELGVDDRRGRHGRRRMYHGRRRGGGCRGRAIEVSGVVFRGR